MFTSKWLPERIGLVDFWYYDNEEFYFQNGHLLLRGSNGSGKSVTMQSFIPLLLDGNKSSERLDPFGTRSRKIENYLLEENDERDNRIGYLYMEFKRKDSDVYTTIGMGLYARKNKRIESWYFVIEDNQRVGIDFNLMKNRLALTKQELKNLFPNQVYDAQSEYMEKVNKALFGFETIDEYREVISLLLQVRSPKLSNSLKPTMINEILSNSLQPLSEEELRPMSEAIANMDEIKDQLDALLESHKAATAIQHVYHQYNIACLFHKANQYGSKLKDLMKTEDFMKTKKNEISDLEKDREVCSKTQKELQQEAILLQAQRESMRCDDIIALKEEQQRLAKETTMKHDDWENKQTQIEDKDNAYQDIRNSISNKTQHSERVKREWEDKLDEMDELQEEIQLEEHDALKEDMIKHADESYDFSYTLKQVEKEQEKIRQGLALFQDVDSNASILSSFKDEQEKVLDQQSRYEQEYTKWENLYQETREEYKERFDRFEKNNTYLKLKDEEMLEIIKVIQRYDEEQQYYKIQDLVNNIKNALYQTIKSDEIMYQNELMQLDSKLRDANVELVKWTNMVDPEPECDDVVLQHRSNLQAKNIPFIPLYKLLDFDESTTHSQRKIIEEALQRMGLLNTVLIEQKYEQEVLTYHQGNADSFLFTSKNIHDLDVQTIIYEEETFNFDELLQAFGCTQKSILSLKDGVFQQGMVSGTISGVQDAYFIGSKTREAYRLQNMSRCQQLVNELQDKKHKLSAKYQECKDQLEDLSREAEQLPKEDDLRSVLEEMKKQEKSLSDNQKEAQRLLEKIEKYLQIEMQLMEKIRDAAEKMVIAPTKKSFQNYDQSLKDYNRCLSDFSKLQERLVLDKEILITLQGQRDSILNDLDTMRAEADSIHEEYELKKAMEQQKQKQLDNSDYESVKKKLDTIIERQNMIPKEQIAVAAKISRIDTNLENYHKELSEKENEKEYQKNLCDQYFSILKEEASLQYVTLDNDDTLYEKVVALHKEYPSIKDKDTLNNDVQSVFYEKNASLQEYGLTKRILFTHEGLAFNSERLDIHAKYGGKKINFYELTSKLQEDIDLQKNLLLDSDKLLYEDILVNTISKKIRSKIQSSRRWVDHMNHYMEQMKTSSSLKLQLQWKSKKAENEEEMDISELVSLLERDASILKIRDLDKLSSHFRSKISSARELSSDASNLSSFHQIMKEIMDYRQWFEFKILYQKTGDKKKEMTNTAFYAFSGGEKAMSMYVPLFSAIGAKFKSAREDAPQIIALDEAFAGVDDKNIDTMFALIEKFDFSYIMNSQVLWGDYPSVKKLSIYELFRPENARFVTVIHYEWNGHVKRMIA